MEIILKPIELIAILALIVAVAMIIVTSYLLRTHSEFLSPVFIKTQTHYVGART